MVKKQWGQGFQGMMSQMMMNEDEIGNFNIKMSFSCLSYRNGKYQGFVNSSFQRQGLGILVDDDLTFHVSNWHENRMQGPTLVYLAHAKYIYGEWKNNQPHGLNVYRSGDTVLLSKYVFGVPSHRCLLIFERHGFACVLGEHNKQWQVIKSGLLVNHNALMKFIQLLQVDVPEHYLSLIKFACAFSNSHNAVRTFPCHQNHCYFGYVNGLAIIFNSNNGLVTVGQHRNEELCEFGGKFISKKVVKEGNFAPSGETVQYKGQRPTQRIYPIYQKMHKRDNNFINEAYESRTKIFTSIQSLIINKLKQIVEESRRSQNVARFDLNESLDYHECDEEESLKLHQLRDKMYSPPKKAFERTSQSQTPVKNQPITSHSNSILKKSFKKYIADASSRKNQEENQMKSITPSKIDRIKHLSDFSQIQRTETSILQSKKPKERVQNGQSYSKINSIYLKTISRKAEQTHRQLDDIFPLQMQQPYPIKSLLKDYEENHDQSNRLQETSSFKRIIDEENLKEKQKDPLQKCILPNKDPKCMQETIYYQKNQEKAQIVKQRPYPSRKREKSIQQFARPTYEDIEERRKRILRDFQELNSGPVDTTPKREKPKIDSPLNQNLISVDKDQSSFGYVPLSISNKINHRRQSGAKLKKEQEKLLQESIQEDRSRDRSSTRRANYNYSGLESRVCQNQNKDPGSISQALPQMTVTPVRQKRTYQYMYE